MASNLPTTRRNVSADDISNLKQLLKATTATFLTPDDADYPKSIQRWSQAAEKPAGAVMLPTTSEDVAVALRYATEHNLDVAVKGGGHSSAGTSSTAGGLLFDLGRMRNVRVDTGSKLVVVGGGCVWDDVDSAMQPHGLATVGGTVGDTGVGGLTLGGGYGWLSSKHGLVIDNLVSATVVLASGEIKTASKTENEDLFWALCGAGQNFAIATEFVLRAHDQDDVWAGMLLYPPTPDHIKGVVAAANNLYGFRDTADGKKTNKSDGRCGSAIVLGLPPQAGGQVMLIVVVVFNGKEEEGKQAYQEFFDIGPVVNTVQTMPYANVNKLFSVPYGMRASMKGTGIRAPIRPEFVQEIAENFTAFTANEADFAGSMVFWELVDPTRIVEQTTGSFANRGYHFNGLVMPMWSKPEHDQKGRQWARDVAALFKDELKRQGGETGTSGALLQYGNYDVSIRFNSEPWYIG